MSSEDHHQSEQSEEKLLGPNGERISKNAWKRQMKAQARKLLKEAREQERITASTQTHRIQESKSIVITEDEKLPTAKRVSVVSSHLFVHVSR